jgi:hypothetical protein
MTVHVGMMVIYVPRPGRRETEMAAMVTAVYPDDRCDLNIYPPMAEFYQQPKVPMLSEMFKTHVWMVPPSNEAAPRLDLRSAKPAPRAKDVAA